MHNHNGSKNHSMIWMMIPCFLLLGILFFGGGKLSSLWYFWPILAGVFVVWHIWMVFKGYGGRSVDNEGGKTNASGEPETKDKHHHSGCCR